MSGRYKFYAIYGEADKVTSHSFSRTVLEYPLGRRVGADSVMSESLGALYGRAVTPPSPGPAALRLHPVRQRKRCRNWPGTRLAEGRRLAQEWRLRGRRGGRTTQSPDLMGLDRGAECRRNCPGNGEEVREEPGLSRQGPGGPAHSRPPAPAPVLRDAANGRTWTVVLELFLFSDSHSLAGPTQARRTATYRAPPKAAAPVSPACNWKSGTLIKALT